MDEINEEKVALRIPPPAAPIPDFAEKHPYFGDVIGAHKVETRWGEKLHVITLGYTDIERPTHSGQQSTEFHTLTVKDADSITVAEYGSALILPFGNPKLMRRFAEETHMLISFAHQLVDVTPPTNRQLQLLFNQSNLDSGASYARALGDTRAIMVGELQIPESTLDDLLKALGKK